MTCLPTPSWLPLRGGSFVAADARQDDRSAGAELARLYDLDLAGQDEDIDLYLALGGRRSQTILELACGSGRICIPLARSGHQVVGVDADPGMLDRARRAWTSTGDAESPAGGTLELVEADITSLDLDRRFDLVVLGFNTLPLLAGRDNQSAALRVAAQHLAPAEGRAVIDVALPTPTDLAAYDGSLELAWQRHDDETGDDVAKLWSAEYDSIEAVATVTTFFDSWPAGGGALRRIARTDRLHLLSVNELLALVEAAGLHTVEVAGDYAMTPLGSGSERVVLVCALL